MSVNAVAILAALCFFALLAHATSELEHNQRTGGSVSVLLLNSETAWTLNNRNGSAPSNIPGHVPGDCFGDLMRSEVLGDPFYRFNDEAYRWVPYTNWSWTRTINLTDIVSSTPLAPTYAELVFEGIQGVADVYLSSSTGSSSMQYHAGRMEDSFRRYVFNVSSVLKTAASSTGVVRLTVDFESSVIYATEQYNRYNTTSPKPVAPAYLTGLPHRNFIRTEQSSFGWDWSPAFAPQGIYRDVFLRYTASNHYGASIDYTVPHVLPLPLNQSVAKNLLIAANAEKQEFVIDTRVYLRGLNKDLTVHAPTALLSVSAPTLFDISGSKVANSTVVSLSKRVDDDELFELRILLHVRNATLWWPHGYGAQNLHHLHVTVQLQDANGKNVGEKITDTIRTGIRAIELVTFGDPLHYDPGPNDHPSDRPSMFFKINGVPIFAKGANLVPFDAFQFRVNQSVMRNILVSAKDANMNTIRVWGGGLFPLQSFYDMADEMGILLWQEMIFACAEYPINANFLWNVRREISHQLKRLGHHPSISIWSGNNENGIYDKGPGSPYEILDYSNVMYEILRQDASRPVWPTSPSTGFAYGTNPRTGLPSGTMDHPLPFKVGGKSGDTHFYNYFTCPNETVYPRTNFASEFGFQSLPWFENIEHETEQGDWSLFSKWMNHRQHHPNGNEEIEALLKQNFKVQNIDFNSTALSVFKRVIYLTQLQQTLCIANEAEFYRRGRNEPYRTMGTLYWQLNQNWQAPSWTSIEYGGDWKVLHYRMKEVYAMFHVSAFINTTTHRVIAHVASDSLVTTPAFIKVFAVSYSATKASLPNGLGDCPVIFEAAVSVPGLGGLFFLNMSFDAITTNTTLCPGGPSSCFLYFEIFDGNSMPNLLPSSSSRRRLGQPSALWLTTVKETQLLSNAGVTARVVALSKAEALLEVESNTTALYTMLRMKQSSQLPTGRFSRNAFVLIPNVKEQITFSLVTPPNGQSVDNLSLPSAEVLESLLYVDTLNDMW